jgi:hypothetical protein
MGLAGEAGGEALGLGGLGTEIGGLAMGGDGVDHSDDRGRRKGNGSSRRARAATVNRSLHYGGKKVSAMLQALFPFVYMVCFALIAGGAFALMTQTLRSSTAGATPRRRHPEAPAPGEEVLYLDLNRERLENLYGQGS